MSIDLDWLKLDSTLANNLINLLNRQLDNAERPSFIGPVQVTSLDFGSNPPDVELVDMRDIYRDFLEDDEDEDHRPVKVTEGGVAGAGMEDEEGFEWVPRRAGVRGDSTGSEFLPPHIRRSYGVSGDYFSAAAIPPADPWTSGLSRPLSFSYGLHSPFNAGVDSDTFRIPSPATPFVTNPVQGHRPPRSPNSSMNIPLSPVGAHEQPLQEPPPSPNRHPNLQLHFNVRWQSNLRVSLQASLLINYPSPMFMSLPIRLSITGLVFNGELAIAYEGERKRVHICILDDLDPYGPTGERKISCLGTGSTSSPNMDMDSAFGIGLGMGGPGAAIPENSRIGGQAPSGDMQSHFGSTLSPRFPKPILPIGQRLLPSIFIESEIGQTDKHVLKNVMRVEKFVQDVIRRTVEEELVFPNFHTLMLGDE